jgi:hypothetical protein
MQDRESQSPVNPGIVEQGLDRQEEMSAGGVDTTDGIRGGPVRERERPDGGQITQREAFSEPGQTGREGALNGARSGGMENRTDQSDPMPGTSANPNHAASRDNPAPGGGLS